MRKTVAAQMAEANRLDEVIDELTVRAEAAEAEVARLRDGILKMQDGLMDKDADRLQCLVDNVPYVEDDDTDGTPR